MKRFSFFTVIVITGLILSACGAPAAPTMNPVDVQSTAQAAAMTMVAETQAAVPTATSLPPTETPTSTPAVTDTPLPLPTLNVTLTSTGVATAAVSNNSGATVDPCANRVLSHSPLGKETIIRIVNQTKATVTVSLYLNQTEAHGECGYRSYTLTKNNDVVITDLVYGCYGLWAFSDDPKEKVNASGGGCVNNPDKWTFEVRADTIKFVGP
jgi:hypothetical protein